MTTTQEALGITAIVLTSIGLVLLICLIVVSAVGGSLDGRVQIGLQSATIGLIALGLLFTEIGLVAPYAETFKNVEDEEKSD